VGDVEGHSKSRDGSAAIPVFDGPYISLPVVRTSLSRMITEILPHVGSSAMVHTGVTNK